MPKKKDDQLQVRMDSTVKEKTKSILDKVGISFSGAINIFFHQIIQNKGLPFSVEVREPSNETEQALSESEHNDGTTYDFEEALEKTGNS